ncbi:dTDP-4-dehydrorhamnose reductase [compost metagenome]
MFAGDAREPYRECDPTGPTGVYGASKLGGELELAAKCSRYMILRTSWVFAAQGNNFVKTMLRLGRERDQLGVVADQQGCPTSAASIARALWTLAMQYRDLGSLHWGTYHFSGTPACTWHEFALEIFRQGHQHGLITKIPQVRGIDSAEYPTPAKRPAWSVMDCSKLREQLGISQPDWRLELAAVITELAQSEVA